MKKTTTHWPMAVMALILAVSLLCGGCGVKQQSGEGTGEQTAPGNDLVYVVYGNQVTTGEYWSSNHGAITGDGKLVMPIDNRQLDILRDGITGKQRYLQTRGIKVTDPSRSREELQEDYINGIYSDEPWKYLQGQYGLYDMNGAQLQADSPRAIRSLFGDVALYDDGKLENMQTGQIYFENVGNVTYVDGHYIIRDRIQSKTRIADEALQVQIELPGNGYVTEGYLQLWQENQGNGLYTLDGQELLPCQYTDIRLLKDSSLCIVHRKQPSDSFVMDLTDGTVRYTTAEGQNILYADEQRLLIRSQLPDGNESTQLVGYDGAALSETYPFFLRCLNEGEGSPVFGDYGSILLDQNGKELYRATGGQWLNWVAPDRIVVEDNNVARLQDLEGNVKSQKDYTGLYTNYALTEDGSESRPAPYVTGYYQYHNLQLYDLMDLDGNLLIEQAKAIQVLSPGRFWVEKGFSLGLMDETGNWLYRQSLFTSAAEE